MSSVEKLWIVIWRKSSGRVSRICSIFSRMADRSREVSAAMPHQIWSSMPLGEDDEFIRCTPGTVATAFSIGSVIDSRTWSGVALA